MIDIFIDSERRLVNATDESDYGCGWTALHYACYQGNKEIVNKLIEKATDVNRKNNDGFTPIFYAAQQGHSELCSLLIGRNADPTICGESNEFPGALDFVYDFPALREIFLRHSNCQQPFNALSPQKLVKEETLDFDLIRVTPLEFQMPALHPREQQYIQCTIDNARIRRYISKNFNRKVFASITPINALGECGPTCSGIEVTYETPVDKLKTLT